MKREYSKLSKAGILLKLQNNLKNFYVPQTHVIKVKDWKRSKSKILKEIKIFFLKKNSIKKLAVRSSTILEDSKTSSQAGKYTSILNVSSSNNRNISKAINEVIKSYKFQKKKIDESEIIIQQMISNIFLSGVAFTKDINTGAPYYVINYDDMSGLTDTVTSGSGKFSNKLLYIYKKKTKLLKSPKFKVLLKSIIELEKKIKNDNLDVEFAIDKNLRPILLQVRRIVIKKTWTKDKYKNFDKRINFVNKKIKKIFKKKNLTDKINVFGQMPDWNPAEIIGPISKMLSYSLYKRLITDDSWSKARKIMGYNCPNEKSLMRLFGGHPYINTKLSFISFLPNNLKSNTKDKLVNFWLEKLKNNPSLHDKIEFEIAITSFSFDMNDKIKYLVGNAVTTNEKKDLVKKLKDLTFNCLDKNSPHSIKNILKKINFLKSKQIIFNKNRDVNTISKIISDCKTYGTIPFAILARHGFIAKALMDSLKNLKILTGKDIENFLGSLKTITTELLEDSNNLNKKGYLSKYDFFKKYGHLRPGTYDILSKKYSEKKYFLFNGVNSDKSKFSKFKLSKLKKIKIDKLLKKYDFKNIDHKILFNYFEDAIIAREYSKFIFTKSISHILDLILIFGKKNNISRKDLSHANISNFLKNNISVKNILKNIKENKFLYQIDVSLRLPHIIYNEAYSFISPYQINRPNYITSKNIFGQTTLVKNEGTQDVLKNKIILIESADPGYDWIFSHQIKGLITKYGGANSHMSIRSAELGLPAAIGCGEHLFSILLSSNQVNLDCFNRVVKPIIIN